MCLFVCLSKTCASTIHVGHHADFIFLDAIHSHWSNSLIDYAFALQGCGQQAFKQVGSILQQGSLNH